MRVAGNKLGHLMDFYQRELGKMYEASEIRAMFALAVEHYLGWSRQKVLTGMEERVNQSDLIRIYDCAKLLAKRIPLQYILGEAWFCGLRFKVNNAVLIPRPETEELVQLVVADKRGEKLKVLDIGTGSGCIPLSLKHYFPSWNVSGCDVSEAALKIAKENGKKLKLEVAFQKLDILKEEPEGKWDIIISNPPYIAEDEKAEMTPEVLEHEPHRALFAPAGKATVFYERIIELCKEGLNAHGWLYFELNPLTANQVKDFAERNKMFSSIEILSDMSGKLRFFRAQRTG